MNLKQKLAIGVVAAVPVLTGGVAYASALHPTTSIPTSANVKATTPLTSESSKATVDSGPDLKGGPNVNSGPNVNVQSGSQSIVGVDATSGASS